MNTKSPLLKPKREYKAITVKLRQKYQHVEGNILDIYASTIPGSLTKTTVKSVLLKLPQMPNMQFYEHLKKIMLLFLVQVSGTLLVKIQLCLKN